MPQALLTLRRWNRVEYERLADLGAFEHDPIELVGGQLIVAEPKGSRHTTGLYARAGIPEYWIANLVDGVVEVYRDPARDSTAPYGWRYTSVETFSPPAFVAPLAVPSARIAVGALLP